MPVQYFQQAQNTFVKGLITEASELTFPSDASVDELNCVSKRDGSKSRRLGVSFETDFELSDITLSDSEVFSTHTWENVGGESNVEFLVLQKGSTLLFYKKSGALLSTQRVDTTNSSGTPYALDLTAYNRPTGAGAGTAEVQIASINGALVVASPEINTLYIERSTVDGSFTATEIAFKVRDFDWQGDIDDYDTPSPTTTPGSAREYDTANAGWVGDKGDAALTTYKNAENGFPPLSHPWYSGKNSNGDFNKNEWDRIFTGNSLIANGHYLLDLYNKDRTTVSGFSGLTTSVESARFSTVVPFAGRVFYSGMAGSTDKNGSRIYFSQLLNNNFSAIGRCYQVNDPTSEELSDLLDTDGGFIEVSGVYNIQKLHVFGPKLYVFAENGVWSISGVDDVFRASEYSVSAITEVGLSIPSSFTSGEGRPYWWSSTGIHTLTVDQGGQSIVESNLSLSTVQTFWDNLDSTAKSKVQGIYDSSLRRVLWFYPDTGETVGAKLNNVLVFDEQLTSFYPWKVSDESSSTSCIIGASFYDGVGSSDVTFSIIDGADTVVDGADTVVDTRNSSSYAQQSLKLVLRDGATNKLSFGSFDSISFLDWGTEDYSSYAESGHDFMGDLTLKKTAPYVIAYQKVTETGWELADEDYSPVRPSSCLLSVYWDFAVTPTATQQVYRYKYPPTPDLSSLDSFGYPEEVISSKVRIRGRGRAMRIRYESERGKDFHLLGWEVVGARNPNF